MSQVKFEIPADDLERASAFYKEVFGWSTTDLPLTTSFLIQMGNQLILWPAQGAFHHETTL